MRFSLFGFAALVVVISTVDSTLAPTDLGLLEKYIHIIGREVVMGKKALEQFPYRGRIPDTLCSFKLGMKPPGGHCEFILFPERKLCKTWVEDNTKEVFNIMACIDLKKIKHRIEDLRDTITKLDDLAENIVTNMANWS